MEEKEKGNASFKEERFEEAVGHYSKALDKIFQSMHKAQREVIGAGAAPAELMELLPSLFGNRAACFYKLGKFNESLADAEQAIALKPAWVKAHHRKAQALVALGHLDQARDAYSIALDGEPENKFLKKQVEELDAKTGRQSAHAKIENYIGRHGTVKGCPTKLSLTMFEVQDMLGEGNYSMVHKAVFRKTGEIFAIKSVQKEKANRMARRHPNLHNELRMEKRLLLRLNHPNVIKLHFTMQDVNSIYYVTELSGGGELWASMRFGRECLVSLYPSQVLFYAAQIVNVLEYLERSGIVHRDLKPENLMRCPVPGTDGRVEFLKLIDFGTAYDLVETDLNGPNFVGTAEYMSPETIEAKAAPTLASDIWAFGCTLYQLHSGRIPFKGSSPYLTFLKVKALAYSLPKYFPGDLVNLVENIFKKEPSDRIGASDKYLSLKRHEYFAAVDFDELLCKPIKPVPTLFELCADALVEIFSGPRPEPGKAINKKRKRKLPNWAKQVGVFSTTNTTPKLRNALMGLFEQRFLLGDFEVFRMFFDSIPESRFNRTTEGSFIGMSEQEEGKFRDSFVIATIGSLEGASSQVVEATMRKLNTVSPTPRLLVVSGKVSSENKNALCTLASNIPIVTCFDGSDSYRGEFGDNYYSFYVGGVLVIVIDSFLLSQVEDEDNAAAAEHAEWFEQQVLTGKLCARHVVIVSHHAWVLDNKRPSVLSDDDLIFPSSVMKRFTNKLQDAGTQIILSGGADRSYVQKFDAESEVHTRILLTNTGRLVEGSRMDDPLVRIVRVQGMDILSDKYLLSELPNWFNLEEEEQDVEPGMEEDKGFSDISESSDESD